MKKIILFFLGFASLLLALYFLSFPKPKTKTLLQINSNLEEKSLSPVTSIAKNLDTPWALAFLPDGKILATEREGNLNIVDPLTGDIKLVQKIKEAKEIGEGGLLGVALHPDFEKNNFLYLYYTYEESGGNTLNRVVRFNYNQTNLTDSKTIVDKIPGSSNHNGGRIKFGPDNFLYITTGDAQEPSLAQNKNSLAGKILRVTDDGKPAPGNPFGNPIYSYGHRNPQGLAWDQSGKLWATEHGPDANDEINLIDPGKNYGWPVIQGNQKRSNMENPTTHSGKDTWAPAGSAVFSNSLFFGGLRGKALFRLNLNTKKLDTLFEGEFGRIREVILGSDNALHITTSNKDGRGNPLNDDDKIIRVDPKKL